MSLGVKAGAGAVEGVGVGNVRGGIGGGKGGGDMRDGDGEDV